MAKVNFVSLQAYYTYGDQGNICPTIFTQFDGEGGYQVRVSHEVQHADEIYHAGDLVVEGDETYVIENVAFFVDGNIIVRDNATLIVRNSKIVLQLKFFGEYWVEVRDNSRFLVDNSTLERTNHHLTLFIVRSGSEAVIKNAACGWDISPEGGKIILEDYDASSACNGIFFNRGKITAVNSKFNIISIPIRGNQKSTVELNNLNPGLIEYSFIEKNDGNDFLELINTTVMRWVVDAGDPVNPSFVDLVVRNSKLWGLWIWFCPGTNVEISNIKPGIYHYWRMSDAWHFDGVGYDIELFNTTIDMFKLQILGNALIENVSGVQVATRGSSLTHVKNSIIQVNLILRGNEYVILEDTEVQGDIIQLIEDRSDLQYPIGRGGTHHLELRRATIKAPFEIASNYTKIEGEANIYPRGVNWVFGIVERAFPIIVNDEAGKPLSNVTVTLFDPQGDLVWAGMTDHTGRTSLNITFTKENHDKLWRLRATLNGMNTSEEIGFLTSTPIILTLSKLASSISLSVSREIVKKGDQITILGSVDPPLAEIAITLTFERPDGSTFVEAVFTGSNGSFNYTLIPKDAGKWSVYASWLGDENYEGASSPSLSFTVEVPLKPAEFVVTGLSVNPAEAQPGQTIKIGVEITNIGEQTGSYTINLKVNDTVVDTKAVTLAGGESTVVTFELVKEEAGVYDIELAGLKGTFTVKEITPPPLPRELYTTIALVAVVAIGVVIIFYRRKVSAKEEN